MFKIIGFYTKDTPYEQVIREYLEKSVNALKLDYHFYSIPSEGNWVKNTQLKPKIILQALKDFPQYDLVILDADCIIREYPILFDNIPKNYDLGVFKLDRNAWYGVQGFTEKELCSGTLFIRNNPNCNALISSWRDKCHYYPITPDQILLQEVLEGQYWLEVFDLPIDYCWIHDLPDGSLPKVARPEKVVIEHFQASRKLKQHITYR